MSILNDPDAKDKLSTMEPHHSHLSHKKTILMQEMNANADSHCKGALRGYPYSVTYVILIFLFNYFLLCNIATCFLLSYILKGIHFGRVLC